MPSNKPATTTPPAALPDGIEIFRAGRHLDDAGVAHHFSEADLDGMAASYSPALREAPLTVGHPKDNLPAYGWVKAVARTAAGALAITPHQVEPQFAEMVQAGRFKKRSASFYPPHAPNNPTPGKWYLRHVAFLGAQPPAVAGLKDIEFSEGDQAGAVNFSETVTTTQEPDDMSKTLQEQLEAAQAQLAAEKTARERAEADAAKHKAAATEAQEKATSFAEKARTDRKAGFVSFAESQVQAGRLLPKDKDMAVATLDALADVQPVEFAEGDSTRKVSPAQWLQDLIAAAKPAVNFGEFAPGNTGSQAQAGAAKGKSDAEVDQAADAYMRQHKVSYAEALTAVTASFTS
ncbi:hypothetical protein B2J88_20240 [Rhodococcus sp. SRB_17]|uniref:hypothetical protein n=1 Tax=Acidovorax sp. SRB_24 TaxID=1962700 RepID=UPI00145E9C43|nr:hypothetical protein [Acidovorax sp. SRB_24]NMM75381.1 hypothetical protein [Acidovorax sp. SRB_24]NMM86668.1 hypothetical protein [Rhodococcus sp. SRB_17]